MEKLSEHSSQDFLRSLRYFSVPCVLKFTPTETKNLKPVEYAEIAERTHKLTEFLASVNCDISFVVNLYFNPCPVHIPAVDDVSSAELYGELL
jgi:hypothetical protein